VLAGKCKASMNPETKGTSRASEPNVYMSVGERERRE